MTSQHVPGREIVLRRIALLSLALFLGCGGGFVQDPLEPVDKFGSVVRLTVQNNSFNDATIYAEWSSVGQRRIGIVTGKTSETLVFDWESPRLRIEAKFMAGQGFTTDEMGVWQGDHLNLVILSEGP